MSIYLSHSHMILLIIFLLVLPRTISAGGGSWQLLQKSIGISAMHMQLLSNDRVIIFDRTNSGPSNLSLPEGQCRLYPNESKLDCTAHSAEYNTLTNSFRPLNLLTDSWCSSGSVLSDGRLAQTGGFNAGARVVRTFQPADCPACDWKEIPDGLIEYRWYATNTILPDGRTIILGGQETYNYEFYPKTPSTSKLISFPFLVEVNDTQGQNNMYPFVFLNVDGNIFVFANNRAILFDHNNNVVVRRYPTIPGGDPRNYPSIGSAVLLPFKNLELGAMVEVEVLVCGGAPTGSFFRARNGQFLPALNTCARMKINDPNPTWVMETMPMARTMGDMVVLPNGDVLIINGARSGTAAWELGRDPVLSPVVYHPDNVLGSRFETMKPTTIPRMYHSSAVLLRDGRVLVGGSNPHENYTFTNVLFPTELSLEAYLPPYLDPTQAELRPNITSPGSGTRVKYGQVLEIEFSVTRFVEPAASIKVTMIRPPFSTHSFSMSQRILVLTNIKPVKRNGQLPVPSHIKVMTPGSANIAPPGFYMLFVVHQNIPSQGMWIKLE